MRASQNIYPLYYIINFQILQIFVAAGSRRKSCWKFFLEIFSWKFFLGAHPKIFSFPKQEQGNFVLKFFLKFSFVKFDITQEFPKVSFLFLLHFKKKYFSLTLNSLGAVASLSRNQALTYFCLKGARSFPISLGRLGRLKLSQICEDFYSENLGSEDLISEGVFYYALIGHLSKILI